MPVVSIALSRLKKMIPNVSEEKIIDMLPFAGLDIEGIDEETIRVEYNPNRPDFSSDYGIIRSLRGIMGIETGLPRIAVKKSDASVSVERGVKSVRPYVFALVARGGKLDDAAVKRVVAADRRRITGGRRARWQRRCRGMGSRSLETAMSLARRSGAAAGRARSA